MKLAKSVLASLVFLVILLSIYLIHMRYFHVNVVLYSSILDGCLAVIVSGGLLFGLNYFNVLNTFEKLQLTLIWLLLSYAFAITIPTVIDRSLSFYILEKIHQMSQAFVPQVIYTNLIILLTPSVLLLLVLLSLITNELNLYQTKYKIS